MSFYKQSIKKAEMDGKLAAVAEMKSWLAKIESKHAEDFVNVGAEDKAARKAEIAAMKSEIIGAVYKLKESYDSAEDPSKGDEAKSKSKDWVGKAVLFFG